MTLSLEEALSLILVGSTLAPFLPLQHWTVRLFDFIKIQLLAAQLLFLGWALLSLPFTSRFWMFFGPLTLAALYNGVLLLRFTKWWPVKPVERAEHHSDEVRLLSANVYQFNTEYARFLQLVAEQDPDIVLTMESNEDWDTAMRPLEERYPYKCKVPLENTYGMHLYSKLRMTARVHFWVADDLPSIEADMRTRNGHKFSLFALHPPPPSPTEEPNSKERDGDLLSAAKRIREKGDTTLVVGDFNNVAWARSTELFRKTSQTIDPRIGRAMCCTFHAKYRFLRVPIDQLYHTADIFVVNLETLPEFGSDHLPLGCRFFINRHEDSQEDRVEDLEAGEMEEVEEMIQEGIEEEGDRDEVARE